MLQRNHAPFSSQNCDQFPTAAGSRKCRMVEGDFESMIVGFPKVGRI